MARDLTVLAKQEEVMSARCRVTTGGGPSLLAIRSVSRAAQAQARDPERPKMPLTPWFRFLAQFRQNQTDVKGKDAMNLAASRWKAMSDVQKKPFKEPYEFERKEYETRLKTYVDSGKKDAWVRAPGKPKRPPSAFFDFLKDYRQKNTNLKVTECARLAGAVWKDMSPTMKLPYVELYNERKKQYDEATKVFKASGREDAWKEGKSTKLGETSKKKEKKKAVAAKTKTSKKKEVTAKAKAVKKAPEIASREPATF